MANLYVVTANLISLAASTTKVAISLASGSTTDCVITGWDISFDGFATGSAAIPVRVQLVRPTGVSSVSGSAFTPSKAYKAQRASVVTARISDTTAGSSPLVVAEYLVSQTSGMSYQFPLGRSIAMDVSDFFELKVISQSGMTTCNYSANLWFEE